MVGNLSLLAVIIKGGWIMVPLLICSVLSLAVVLERALIGLRAARVLPADILTEVRHFESYDSLRRVCQRSNSPLARVILVFLDNLGASKDELIEAVEFAGRKESQGLQRNLGVLGTVAAISPLLGLLGTVVGIIHTFSVIEQHGIGNPQLLAGGISQALVATAAGICVAVPSMIFYRYFFHRCRALTLDIEGVLALLMSRIGVRQRTGAPSEV